MPFFNNEGVQTECNDVDSETNRNQVESIKENLESFCTISDDKDNNDKIIPEEKHEQVMEESIRKGPKVSAIKLKNKKDNRERKKKSNKKKNEKNKDEKASCEGKAEIASTGDEKSEVKHHEKKIAISAKIERKSHEEKKNGLPKDSKKNQNKTNEKYIKGRKENKEKGNKEKGNKGVDFKDKAKPMKTNNSKSKEPKPSLQTKKEESSKEHSSEERRQPKFSEYLSRTEIIFRYHQRERNIIRGKIRITKGGFLDKKSYVTCDRGTLSKDVCIQSFVDRNRALDGDFVYVELIDEVEIAQDHDIIKHEIENNYLPPGFITSFDSEEEEEEEDEFRITSWKNDDAQRKLWNPKVDVKRKSKPRKKEERRFGKVVYVEPPGMKADSCSGSGSKNQSYQIVVGRILDRKGIPYFYPINRNYPLFTIKPSKNEFYMKNLNPDMLYSTKFYYDHSWSIYHIWPKCEDLQCIGAAYNPETETKALLMANGVDHGDFSNKVLKQVDDSVKEGMYISKDESLKEEWKPSPEMLKHRRDYRDARIFTIDPTTAKDLDDALHIKLLENNKVEIGVHIADVSHFIKPDTPLDLEARKRATTVYLVNKTVPMLPRPLCEIACSLNENVERLAFSCVWIMNLDGTLCTDDDGNEKVWFGKTVIKSCARLDYDTAQNIIEKKVAYGEDPMDELLWPVARRPSNQHSVEEVAEDVRLLHSVAMNRRRLRFENGALTFGRVKLRFSLAGDDSTPELCEPYPLKDSNRLVEEYMLLANYLVAQQLIQNVGELAVLRHHPPPEGLSEVVAATEKIGFHIDITCSKKLHESLCNFTNVCTDDILVQGVTEMLTVPMKSAEYFAAGCLSEEDWRHFALNIPYYTHFTSPIRRYPDVLVHRLLQYTLMRNKKGKFPKNKTDLQAMSEHCNKMRNAAKTAQERSDRVFLALYVKNKPVESVLAITIAVKGGGANGEIVAYVPSLGIRHTITASENVDFAFLFNEADKSIVIKPKGESNISWNILKINMFTKLSVQCLCKPSPPLDVYLKLVGPWES